MIRTVLIVGLLAAVLACAAGAQPRPLFPGVTYQREVQFTRRGPVVLHVVSAPRPVAPYALEPVISNGVIVGRERLTAIERRLAAGARTVGVNGDFFFADGRPPGIVIQDGVLHRPPTRNRASLGIDREGRLRVARVALFGTWQGTGPRRPVAGLNQPPGRGGVSLFTPAWGPTTPPSADTIEATISPFPTSTPNTELSGQVVELVQGGGRRIPPGGAVLVGRGANGSRIPVEAPVGTTMRIRLALNPDWADIVDAIGGGPVLVRDGRAVFRAREAFSPLYLAVRQARTAVAQRRDGRILLVTVDGGKLGYSSGMTNFELAQTLVRLGAVTGYALAGGNSAAMAADGRLLNRPSHRSGEAAIADALLLLYRSAPTR